MRFAFLIILFASAAVAQTPPKPNDMIFSVVVPDPNAPKTVHEFAVKEINEYFDYDTARWKSKGYAEGFAITTHEPTMVFSFEGAGFGGHSEFSVGRDGKVKLENISIEDAFLAMYAEQLRKQMEQEKQWDSEDRLRKQEAEKAKISLPPNKLIYHGSKWELQNIPDWSEGKYAGQTFCGMKIVKLLETTPNKQGVAMHEAMHVVTECDDTPGIHKLITEVAPGLVKLMQDNPDFVDYLIYGYHQRPCPAGGCDDGWNWDSHKYDCVKGGKWLEPSKASCKDQGLEPVKWPTVASAHLVLDPVQAKRQDHPVPACTGRETTETCFDPTMKSLTFSVYEKKENCERMEGVDCAKLYDEPGIQPGIFEPRYAPIGKPVIQEDR